MHKESDTWSVMERMDTLEKLLYLQGGSDDDDDPR